MIGLLTCLVLIVAAGLSAEAVRVACLRRLLAPLPTREESAPIRELELVGVSTPD